MAVCVEGNIGAGKSQLLWGLWAMHGMTTRPEPVERWRPLLNQAYNCGRGLVALQARITLDTSVPPQEQVVERDPHFQVPVFIRAALDSGSISRHEGEVLTDLHARVVQWRPKALLYLRCEPVECLARVRRRGRVEEDGLTLATLQHLHDLYEAAFAEAPDPKQCVDVTDMDPETVRRVAKAFVVEQLAVPPGHERHRGVALGEVHGEDRE